MELRHLRYFRVVAEELHFGRAAARLHMEPQPLNFQIKQLERELGFALLSHRENRTQLTAAGTIMLAEAIEILAAADRAVEHASLAARGESGLLRIGYPTPKTHDFLAPAIKQFHAEYPDVTFDLKLVRPIELEPALNGQELDLGFSLLPAPDDNFGALTLGRWRQVVVIPCDDPLAQREHLSWDDLDGRAAISLKGYSPEYQRRVDEMLAKNGIRLGAVQDADEIETAVALVRIGFGILIAPSIAAITRDKVIVAELPTDAPEMDYGAIWRRSHDHAVRERFLQTLAVVGESSAIHISERLLQKTHSASSER